jgi:hypothetical protein
MVTRYRRSERPLAAEVDSEVLLFDPEPGMYFATRGVGAVVWEALSEPRTLSELCEMVVERFEVERDVCEADLAVFIRELVEADLAEAT